jgi:hypothetical protein
LQSTKKWKVAKNTYLLSSADSLKYTQLSEAQDACLKTNMHKCNGITKIKGKAPADAYYELREGNQFMQSSKIPGEVSWLKVN